MPEAAANQNPSMLAKLNFGFAWSFWAPALGKEGFRIQASVFGIVLVVESHLHSRRMVCKVCGCLSKLWSLSGSLL